jgi:SAM-dependent methyltransferase
VTFDQWLADLDRRHLESLTASEVARALRALSSCYVERRTRLAAGAALDGKGKRAAFALFYGVQHFLLVSHVARSLLDGETARYGRIVDLGCGTGTAGASLALQAGVRRVDGYDINAWAVAEANLTYRAFELQGRAMVSNMRTVRLPADALVLAAYAVNEIADEARNDVLERLLDAHRRGASILVIEPIARRTNRWWNTWSDAFRALKGRADEWRFPVTLPDRQRTLAKAAGLDVRELTARSLYLAGNSAGQRGPVDALTG